MKVAEHSRGITLGRHLHKPGGIFEPIEHDDIGAALALVLQEHGGRGAWWAPGIFEDDVRHGDRWRGAWTLGVDGDYYAKGLGHSPPSDDVRKLLAPALASVLAGALYHDTPRGFRNVLLLDRCITDTDQYTKLATAIQRRVERGLADAGILGEVRRVAGGDVVVERDGFIVDTAPSSTVHASTSPRTLRSRVSPHPAAPRLSSSEVRHDVLRRRPSRRSACAIVLNLARFARGEH